MWVNTTFRVPFVLFVAFSARAVASSIIEGLIYIRVLYNQFLLKSIVLCLLCNSRHISRRGSSIWVFYVYEDSNFGIFRFPHVCVYGKYRLYKIETLQLYGILFYLCYKAISSGRELAIVLYSPTFCLLYYCNLEI